MGQSADFRDQFTSASRFVVMMFASNCLSNMLINNPRLEARG
jgi:hypothetical protein